MKEEYVWDLPMSFDEDFRIGIVVELDPDHKQFHCGLAFNLDKDQQVVHLATHNRLICDSGLSDFQCIIKPTLPVYVQESFVALCEVVRDEINAGAISIPYGFTYDEYASITPEGQLILSSNEIGLTCATFVLTLFHSCGFDLVDVMNWPARDEDRKWYDNIFSLFEALSSRLSISSSHLEKLKSQRYGPRFRPEEVAVSSALYEGHPADTALVWDHGKQLNAYMWSIV